MKLNPELYLRPCGDGLKRWLRELKKRQVTYLISGSDPEYVEWVASYCLGNDWRNYFDYVVCASKKPGFFTGQRPFRRHKSQHSQHVAIDDEEIEAEEFLPANTPVIYTQGNWTQLKNSMAEYCGVDRPKCLYFGDHLIQDVVAADTSRLHVVAMVEELAAESQQLSDDRSLLNSKRWGSFFYDQGLHCLDLGPAASRDGPTRMNTLWANLVRKHARICISYMETLCDYPVDHGFAIQEGQEKFLGFLPTLPNSLLT